MDAASLFGGPPASSPGASTSTSSPFPTGDNRNAPPSAASLFGVPPEEEDSYEPPAGPTPLQHRSKLPQVQEIPDDFFGGDRGRGGGVGWGSEGSGNDSHIFGTSTQQGVPPPPRSAPIVTPPPPPTAPPRAEDMPTGLFGTDGDGNTAAFAFGDSRVDSEKVGGAVGIRDVLPPPVAKFGGVVSSAPAGNAVLGAPPSGDTASVFIAEGRLGARAFAGPSSDSLGEQSLGMRNVSPPPPTEFDVSRSFPSAENAIFGAPPLGNPLGTLGEKNPRGAGGFVGPPCDSFGRQPPGATINSGFNEAGFRRSSGDSSRGGNAFWSSSPNSRSSRISEASRPTLPAPGVQTSRDREDRCDSQSTGEELAMLTSKGGSYPSPPASDVGASLGDVFGAPPANLFGDLPPTTDSGFGRPSPPPASGAPLPRRPSDGFSAPPADLFGGLPPSLPGSSTSKLASAPPQPNVSTSPPARRFPSARGIGTFEDAPLPPPPPAEDREGSQRGMSPPSGSRDDDSAAGTSRSRESSMADRSRTLSSNSPYPPPLPPSSGPELGSPPASTFDEASQEIFGKPPQNAGGGDPPSTSYFGDNSKPSTGSKGDPWGADEGAFGPDRGATPSAAAVFGPIPSEGRAFGGGAGAARIGEIPWDAGATGVTAFGEVRTESGSGPPPRGFAEAPVASGVNNASSDIPAPKAFGSPPRDPVGEAPDHAFGGGEGHNQSGAWWQTEIIHKEQADKTVDAEGSSVFGGAGTESKEPRFPAVGCKLGESPQQQGNAFTPAAQELGPPPTDIFGGLPAESFAEADGDWQQQMTSATPTLPPPSMASTRPDDVLFGPNHHTLQSAFVDDRAMEPEETALPATVQTNTALPVGPLQVPKQGEARAVSPSWEGELSPPLELGVFGPPPADALGTKAGDTIGASSGAKVGGAENDCGHNQWEMCSSEENPPMEQSMAVEDSAAARPQPPPPPQIPRSHASSPPSPPKLFGSRSESWRVSHGSSMGSTRSKEIEGMFAGMGRESPSSSGYGSDEGIKSVSSFEQMASFKAVPAIGVSDAASGFRDGRAESMSVHLRKSYLALPGPTAENQAAIFHGPSYAVNTESVVGLESVAEDEGQMGPEVSISTPFREWKSRHRMNAGGIEGPPRDADEVFGVPSSLQMGSCAGDKNQAKRPSGSLSFFKADVLPPSGTIEKNLTAAVLKEKEAFRVHSGQFDASQPEASETSSNDVSKLSNDYKTATDDDKVLSTHAAHDQPAHEEDESMTHADEGLGSERKEARVASLSTVMQASAEKRSVRAPSPPATEGAATHDRGAHTGMTSTMLADKDVFGERKIAQVKSVPAATQANAEEIRVAGSAPVLAATPSERAVVDLPVVSSGSPMVGSAIANDTSTKQGEEEEYEGVVAAAAAAADDDGGWGEDDWGIMDEEERKTLSDKHIEGASGVEGGQGEGVASVKDNKKADKAEHKDENDILFGSSDEEGGGASIDGHPSGEVEGIDGAGSGGSEYDSGRDTTLSVAETTASDFFAPVASPGREKLVSPKPMSRNSSRASLSGFSQLSDDDRGSTSGGRREKKNGRVVNDGLARLTYSPFLLANGPPMFPLTGTNYPRARRLSTGGGGLPPPMPSAAATAAAPAGPPSSPASDRGSRATWRSLSPSRLDDKDRWGMSPILRDRRGGGGSAGGSPRARAIASASNFVGGGGGINVALSYSQKLARVGGLTYLPPRPGLSKPVVETTRFSEREPPPSVEPTVGMKPSQAVSVSYRGKPKETPGYFTSSSTSTSVITKTASTGAPSLYPVRSNDRADKALETAGVTPLLGPSSGRGCLPLPQPEPVSSHKTDIKLTAAATESKEVPLSSSSGVGKSKSPQVVPTRRRPNFGSSEDLPGMPSLAAASSDESVRKEDGSPPPQSNATPAPIEAPNTRREQPLLLEASTIALKNPKNLSSVMGGDESNENHGGGGNGNGGTKVPILPTLATDVFVSSGDFGVTARPSPLVNTSSPLTRRPNAGEPSLFGAEDSDGENGKARAGDAADGAASLFAAHAPAGSADALFTPQGSDPRAPAAAGGDDRRSFGDNGSSGNPITSVDPFSEGPPPKNLLTLPTSLPNPWGSSPQKQPLAAPKLWPTKGGTGFDRPVAPKNTPSRPAESSSERADAIPAAFVTPAVTDDHGSLGGSALHPREVEGTRGNAFSGRSMAASFMPPGVSAARPAAKYSSNLGPNRSGGSAATGFKGPHGGGMPVGGWGSGLRTTVDSSMAGADNSARDPSVKPPGVIAVFGFGGRLVCMHPRQKMRLASAPGVERLEDEHPGNSCRLRKGPVKVWCVKDLTETQEIIRDADTFPGPAAMAPAKKVREYVDARAGGGGEVGGEERYGERLLWTVAALSLQFKGRLTSEAGASDPTSPEAALVKFLKGAHARLKEASLAKSNTLNHPLPSPARLNGGSRGGGGVGDESTRVFPRSATTSHARIPSNELLYRPGGAGVGGTGSGISSKSFSGNFAVAPRSGSGGIQGGVTATPMPSGVGPFGGIPVGFGGVGGEGVNHGPAAGAVGEVAESAHGSREEVEALLVDGKKEEAVDASVRAGLWGLALLIASQCSVPLAAEAGDAPPQSPYQRVVRLYSNAFLQSGTPLYTMALAFSGQAGAAIKHGGKSLSGVDGTGGGVVATGGGGGGGGFEENWMATAAAIISNKVAGWAEQLIGLSDRLSESGEVPAAHALCLVADVAIDLPTTKGARLVLPGVDHRNPADRALRTRESADAVHILEVLDLARRDTRGRNSALQGHKLRLAMRLADLGFLEKAAQYAASTREEVALMGGRSQGGSEQCSPYSPHFVAALHEFEDRVCAALGVSIPNSKSSRGGGIKKERSAGSAAAGAGGWLLNTVTNLVKTSATPGPAPPHAKSSAHASQPSPPHGGSGAAPQQLGPPQGGNPQSARPSWAGSNRSPPPQQQQRQETHKRPTVSPTPRPEQPSLPNPLHPPSSNEQGSGAWQGGGGDVGGSTSTPPLPDGVMGGHGPRPPVVQGPGQGVRSWGAVKSGGALERATSAPTVPNNSRDMKQQPPRAGTSPDNGFGLGGGMMIDGRQVRGTGDALERITRAGAVADAPPSATERKEPPRPQIRDDSLPPGAGAAATAHRRLNKDSAKAFPHVSSEPVLGAAMGKRGGEPPKSQGSRVGGKEKAGDDQAPRSEPRAKSAGRGDGVRRSSASAVTAKPGRFTKLVTKWLYPDAKHADIGQQMEAYFDKEKKKWIFPGEAPEDNAPAAPSAPPTAAQLSSPLGPPTGSSSPASTSPGLDANDPLAALMAPPKVPLGGPRRHATTGRMGVGGPPISGGSPPLPGGPPSGGMNWARPAGGSIGSPFAAVPGPGGGGRGGKVTAFAPKSSGGGSATSASRGSSVSSGAEGASSGGN